MDPVNKNTYIKFGENLSICFQDIERKQNYERQKDERNDRHSPLFQSGAKLNRSLSELIKTKDEAVCLFF